MVNLKILHIDYSLFIYQLFFLIILIGSILKDGTNFKQKSSRHGELSSFRNALDKITREHSIYIQNFLIINHVIRKKKRFSRLFQMKKSQRKRK
jgi:hypothetical protein